MTGCIIRDVPKSKSRKKTKPSSRPYVPKKERPKPKPSPGWYPYFMIGLMLLGVLIIVFNYMDLVIHTGPQNLWIGLGFIAAGFLASTKYR